MKRLLAITLAIVISLSTVLVVSATEYVGIEPLGIFDHEVGEA